MKRDFVFLSLALALGSFSTSARATDVKPQLDIPPDFKDFIPYKPGAYGKILITGRCIENGEELDGPKESRTLLEGDSGKFKQLLAFSSKLKTLYESGIPKGSSKTVEVSAEQSGCSHMGVAFTILVRDSVDVKKPAAVWAQGAKWFAGIPLSKSKDELVGSLKKWIQGKPPAKCEITGKKILCSNYADPNNYEFSAEPFEKDQGLLRVTYTFYYVL